MGSEPSKAEPVGTVYFPLTRCQETAESSLCRLDGYPADFGRCVGTGVRIPDVTSALIRVDRIARNRAECRHAKQGDQPVEVGFAYPESALTTYATHVEADMHARALYGHLDEDLGCAWVDAGWVD
jgi:hypothetical protein